MEVESLATRLLTELSRQPGSEEVVLGGYFALRRFVDYRTTHDIDAWWKSRATPRTENAIRSAMRIVAESEGLELGERRFGETVSFELSRQGRRVFSFQIAVRSVELEPPEPSAWSPILIETLRDNVGSKMNALVDRGAPRDLMDIYEIVRRGVLTASECWQLWQRKNPGAAMSSGKQKVLANLAGLEQRRPLSGMAAGAERDRAGALRKWFREEFCRP